MVSPPLPPHPRSPLSHLMHIHKLTYTHITLLWPEIVKMQHAEESVIAAGANRSICMIPPSLQPTLVEKKEESV